jgi:D-glycero-alpha-D-manno-heptose 1-phosphate guanylyltransferase
MPNMPDAIVLCGGAGLRLRSITEDAPKSLARIAGRPFLEFLLRQLRRHGFQRVILAVGYREDLIRAKFGERAFGLELTYSIESSPLGTGGALRNAADLAPAKAVLVMNGDSYTDVNLNALLLRHDETKADASVVVVRADERSDCGSVVLDGNGNLERFVEKEGPGRATYINAGIYVLSHSLLDLIPAGVQASLERDLFPRWIQDCATVKGFIHPGRCVDIGTPDRYWAAQQALASAEKETAASTAGG